MMKKTIFAMISMSMFLFGADVSSFDIKAIKLGMSKNEVLKRMPCSSPHIVTNRIENSNEIQNMFIECKSSGLFVELDSFKQVFFIRKSIKFNNKPIKEVVENKFYKKYGVPDKKLTVKKGRYEYCYGDSCRKRTGYDQLDFEGRGLSIEFFIDSKDVVEEFRNSITFLLQDKNMERENEVRVRKLVEEIKKKQRYQESSIDI